jgi:hypothetical protein
VDSVAGVWAQWDRLKRLEKRGTRHERASALDGVPRHLPALLRAEKLLKKAFKAGLLAARANAGGKPKPAAKALGRELLRLVQRAQAHGLSAEALLLDELRAQERAWRHRERAKGSVLNIDN